jgi:hypothetical protein
VRGRERRWGIADEHGRRRDIAVVVVLSPDFAVVQAMLLELVVSEVLSPDFAVSQVPLRDSVVSEVLSLDSAPASQEVHPSAQI